MACRQTAGCHQIKPCSTDTCCSVDAHMCIEAGESVFNSIVHFRVCRAVYRCVLVNMTLCVCSSPYVPTHARICFCTYRLCVYVHINALSCCPGHCLLHNEGQTVEKGIISILVDPAADPLYSSLSSCLLFLSPPSSVIFSRLGSCCKHWRAGCKKNIAVWHHHGNGHGF